MKLIQITQEERALLKKAQREVSSLPQKTTVLHVSQRRTMVALVVAEVPAGVTHKEWQAYLEDAVGTMKGSYNPEDPLFDLDSDTVKAKVIC